MSEFLNELFGFLQETGFYQMFAFFLKDHTAKEELWLIEGMPFDIAAGWKTLVMLLVACFLLWLFGS